MPALSKFKATLIVLVVYFIWGVTVPAIKLSLEEIPPFSFAFLRFALAGILISPFFLADDAHHPIKRKDLPLLITLGLLGPTLSNALYYFGLQKTTALDAGFIHALFPIVMAIGSALFLKERLIKLRIIGAVIGTLGVAALIAQPIIDYDIKTAVYNSGGNVLIIGSLLTWAAYTIGSKEIFTKYSVLTITAFSFVVAMVSLLPFAVFEYLKNPNWVENVSNQSLFGLGIMVIFGSILAYLLYETAITSISAHRVGFVSNSQPLFTTIAAILILDEVLTKPLIIAAVLIIAGVILTTIKAPNIGLHRGHRF
ncbi:MAG TPA: DMT family transporter [Patescibacteria group bacterium]